MSTNNGKRDREAIDDSLPGSKRVRSQEPDVTVVVGTGEDKEEFQCYRLVLSLASECFDAMLSAGMKENLESKIEFPDKTPQEWRLFYSFLDPATSRSAKISSDNVEALIPWFHEYQMSSLLEECDNVLHYVLYFEFRPSASMDGFYDFPLCSQMGSCNRILRYALLSVKYGLGNCRRDALLELPVALQLVGESLDTAEICVLIPPLLQHEATSRIVWDWIQRIQPILRDEVDFSDFSDLESLATNSLFPYLLSAGIKKQKMKRKLSIAKTCMRSAVEFPKLIDDSLPGNVTLDGVETTIGVHVRKKLENMLYEEWSGNGIVDIPSEWASDWEDDDDDDDS
eukprot:CAMPEP_0117044608 /NCGR_PEP_ID=MMETSP0472-20121206/30913_1 /TAXON_ID=693140 ORGANISM="Tiarina fusus, Strain LIS" /NCGR_SAMPLE_ID=MMETSP0472 /ASSEMBLY_ACC=CAM_ASM_000603 /LENGTH=340 /DNA_ID=CAMNT_0004756397 /DNA_START=135 /DNA_END=1157 /DNA_ORIENTATION=-